MQEADNAFDAAKGCKQFQLYINCYKDVLNDPLCTNVTEVASINELAVADRNGMCMDDGTVTTCGNLVSSCMGEVVAIANDYANKNATAACSLQNKILTCSDKMNTEPTCTGTLKNKIKALINLFLETGMLTGCDGACGFLIGVCMSNYTSTMGKGDFINMNWNGFCSGVYTALDCVGKLKTNGNCTGNDQVASMLDSQNRVLGDYCISSGQPSASIQQLQLCTSDWNAVKSSASVQGRCQADAAYLECSAQVSDSTELQPVLLALRKQIDDKETITHCPIVGSCPERLAICNSLSQETNTGNSASSTDSCDQVKTALSCFDFVRSDASCSAETLQTSTYETGLAATMDTACADACADRLDYCSFWERALLSSSIQTDQYCRLAKSASTCFNKVRTDANCQNSNAAKKSSFENSLQSDITAKCGVGELAASVFLVCAVLLQSVLHFV
ncbi:hypothetical protein BsWGS_05888 [Bradybaena similaris]